MSESNIETLYEEAVAQREKLANALETLLDFDLTEDGSQDGKWTISVDSHVVGTFDDPYDAIVEGIRYVRTRLDKSS